MSATTSMRARALGAALGLLACSSALGASCRPSQAHALAAPVELGFELVNELVFLPVSVEGSEPLGFVLDPGDAYALIVAVAQSLGLEPGGGIEARSSAAQADLTRGIGSMATGRRPAGSSGLGVWPTAGRRYPETPMKNTTKRREVGSFTVDCEVANVQTMKPLILVPKMLVDTGSEYTWVPESVLRELRIQPVKKDLVFQMANGQTITRSIGFAFLRAGEFFTVDEVVFGQPGDLALLGARTLEGFGARVDPQAKRLVASGPHLAALARV